MTTSQILELDCRIEENKETIQKVLKQIKPLAKCPEGKKIPLQKIERCFKVLCNKYGTYISFMYPDTQSNDKYVIWQCDIRDARKQKIGTSYGCTFYECIAKAVILIYSKTRRK